jgi:hypothetical protein
MNYRLLYEQSKQFSVQFYNDISVKLIIWHRCLRIYQPQFKCPMGYVTVIYTIYSKKSNTGPSQVYSHSGLTLTVCSTPKCRLDAKKFHKYTEYNKLTNIISHFILTGMHANLFSYNVTFKHIYVTTSDVWMTYLQ